MTVKVIVLLSVLLWTVQAQDCSIVAKLSRFSQLNVSPLYELYWNVTGSRINFVVRVETEGWVGFGISPHGRMLDSDVVIGFVDDFTGAANLTDRRTAPNTNVVPTIDAQQDWNLVAGSQDGNFTTLEFYRAIDTGDATGDRVIGQLVNLIWSFRKDDNIDLSHTVRGVESNVSLLPPLFFNDFTSSCGCDSSITCREGRRLDPASCECVCDSPANTCPTGQTYDSSVCGCVCDAEQQCCEGQVFDEDSCSCRCESVLNCSAGYVFDTKSCQCVCEGSISEDVWYTYHRNRECRRDNNKVFSILSCGCECHAGLLCHRKKVIDPDTCKCVCPTSNCTSPKAVNPYTCDCQCNNYQRCGYYQQWDADECRCKCQEDLLQCLGKKIADPDTCSCVCPESTCTSPKAMNSYTCDCQCGNYKRCSYGYRWDENECRCKCQERSCYRGERFNRTSCECVGMCPQNDTRCRRYYTFDYDTCQCNCTRRCRDHEVLDSECRCTRKPEPTTIDTAPPTSSPPLSSDLCSSLSYNKCSQSERNHEVSCRWDGRRCTRACCKPNRSREHRTTTSSYCSWISQSYCNQSLYCIWEC